MSPEILGLLSLAALFIFIFVGFPISLTLIFLGIIFGLTLTPARISLCRTGLSNSTCTILLVARLSESNPPETC